MTFSDQARRVARRFPGLLIAAFVVIAVIAPAFAYRSLASSPSGRADGVIPDGTTVLDAEVPGVANLDPDLLHALRRAASDSAEVGVEIDVESGWRSPYL